MIEHEVVDLIHVKKVEVPGARRSNSHFVVEQPVAADGLHAHFFLRAHEVLAPLLAQSHDSAVRTGGLFPVVRQRTQLPAKINPDFRASRCLSLPIKGVKAVGHRSSHRHSCSCEKIPAINHSLLLAAGPVFQLRHLFSSARSVYRFPRPPGAAHSPTVPSWIALSQPHHRP